MQPFININPNVSTQSKINLFDFAPQKTQPQTSYNVPKSIQFAKTIQPNQPAIQTPTTSNITRIGPQAQAEQTDIIKSFYDNEQIPYEDKKLVSDAISKGMNRQDAENYLTTQYSKKDLLVPQKGYFAGALEDIKTTPEAFKGLGERTQERFMKSSEIMQDEGVIAGSIAGGLAGLGTAWDTAFTAGLQILKTVSPESVDEAVAGGIQTLAPAIQKASDKIETFKQTSPEAKRLVDKASLLLEGYTPIKGGQIAGQVAKKTAPIIKEGVGKTISKVEKGIEDLGPKLKEIRVNQAKKQVLKGEDILYEAVNPTTRENKAILKQRVQDLMPYIEKSPLKNSLEEIKTRIDNVKFKAGDDISNYEKTIGVKGQLKTAPIIKQIENKFIEKTSKGVIINEEQAKIANQLIDKLKELGPIIKDKDIIKIRRSWDDIIKKNKGFMQSAESNIKGDIFDEANKFFREEIKKSNTEYAKYLQNYHKATTLSDVIEATIQRRVGQTKGGFIKRGFDTGARIMGAGTGGLPGYLASEALIQGSKFIASPGFQLTRGAKLLKKGQEKLKTLSPKQTKNGMDSNVNNLINNSVDGRVNVNKPLLKPKLESTLKTLTKDNVDEVVSKITTDKTKIAQVKQVIQKYLKEYGENIKNYLSLLADDIADIIGGRTKLLGGENAKLFDKSRWQQAKDMTKAGKSADEIWKETGWERGTDGKWRFEIDDSKAEISDVYKNKNSFKLVELLNLDELYKNYPDFRNIKIKTFQEFGGSNGFVEMGKDGELILSINTLFKKEAIRENLIHEVQHIIQTHEKFARGGSPTEFFKGMIDDIAKLERQAENGQISDKIYFQKRKELKKQAENMYKSLAGEVEARNIESRLLMSSSERKLLRPEKTEDVPRSKQIIKKDGGTAMSEKLLKTKDSLIKEAKKYKSFDEFKKDIIDKKAFEIRQDLYKGKGLNLRTVYHGTDGNSFNKIKSSGTLGRENDDITFFTTSKKEAKEYAQNKSKYRGGNGKGIVIEVQIPNGELRKGQQGVFANEIEGKGIFRFNKNYIDINGNNVDLRMARLDNEGIVGSYGELTEAQLKQIYEQAHKK